VEENQPYAKIDLSVPYGHPEWYFLTEPTVEVSELRTPVSDSKLVILKAPVPELVPPKNIPLLVPYSLPPALNLEVQTPLV
jgi:hypothetical protein